MLPAYNAQGFAGVDLRKYHVRDMKDAIRFIEFTSSRMEELHHVVNKFSTKYSTLNAVVKQMQAQQQKINDLYGAPSGVTIQTTPTEDTEKAVIEKVEENTNKEERAALLDEMRQAIANENLQDAANQSESYADNLIAEFEKYKAIETNTGRVMYYRDGKLVKVADVPDDIKRHLLEQIEDQKEETDGQSESSE